MMRNLITIRLLRKQEWRQNYFKASLTKNNSQLYAASANSGYKI